MAAIARNARRVMQFTQRAAGPVSVRVIGGLRLPPPAKNFLTPTGDACHAHQATHVRPPRPAPAAAAQPIKAAAPAGGDFAQLLKTAQAEAPAAALATSAPARA